MNNEYHRPFSLAMFQISLLVAIAYVLVASSSDFTAAGEADSSRAYASVCLSVRDETGSKEVAFTPEVEPGTGKSIIAHAVASAPCILVVVALNKRDGQLAYGWRPQFVELDEEWQEVRLPEKNKAWRWELKGEPFDFYVLIMPAGSSLAQEIRRLVTAMQVPTEEEGLLKLQTNRLRELISRAAGDSDPSKHQATTT
ncbi:MAG: hypothetical protein JO251_17180, partial [Verrucomicrobia bacterium]|nr:hypothetical protein [Verrucomicrobiota bacterium]